MRSCPILLYIYVSLRWRKKDKMWINLTKKFQRYPPPYIAIWFRPWLIKMIILFGYYKFYFQIWKIISGRHWLLLLPENLYNLFVKRKILDYVCTYEFNAWKNMSNFLYFKSLLVNHLLFFNRNKSLISEILHLNNIFFKKEKRKIPKSILI